MSNMINVCFILISISFMNVLSFNCGYNEINNTIHKVPSPESKRKLANAYTPIKIKMDYTYLESQGKSEYLTTKVKDVLDKTISIFESLLSVNHIEFKFENIHATYYCGIKKYSNDIINRGKDYDLVIFPYFNDSLASTSIQAAATACLAIEDTMQPKMGIVMINPNLNFHQQNSEKFLKLLFLHELSHVLIYHPTFFFAFNMLSSKVINNEKIYYISSPKVVEKAKLHFGCNSIVGVPLENYGGKGSAGSHWESRFMLGDYMIATDYPEIVISDISLAVFEDSGFYKVNYYSGGLFRFGKGEGCDFFNKNCIINKGTPFANEFCINSQEPFCTSGHLSKGHCYMAKYNSNIESYYQYFSEPNIGGYAPAAYCPISLDHLYDKSDYYFSTNCNSGKKNTIHSDYGEVIGENSICVESSLLPTSSNQINMFRSICYSATCDKYKKKVILNIGSGTVVCPEEGGTLNDPSGYKGKVNCPDYNSVCTSNIWCNDPLDCIEKKIEADKSSYSYSYQLRGVEGNNAIYTGRLSLFSIAILMFSLLL